MTAIDVPERNKRVKQLLERTYLVRGHGQTAPLCPGVKISVTAGKGSAYHWIEIKFDKRVPNPLGMLHNRVEEAIADLIIGAGIEVSTYPRDDAGRDYGDLPCIRVTMPHQFSPEASDELREAFAKTVVEAIEEYYPRCFFPKRDVTLTATTSDCPVVRVDLGTGEVYNVTITRARR